LEGELQRYEIRTSRALRQAQGERDMRSNPIELTFSGSERRPALFGTYRSKRESVITPPIDELSAVDETVAISIHFAKPNLHISVGHAGVESL
jgi:hypothetical protein